jgi:Mg2+ and Co2+ transporter CorA
MTTQQTTILVFDPHPDIKAHLLDVIFDRLPDSGIDDPYKIHLCFLEYLVHLQDEAVWAIRDLVRNTEKKREVRDAKAKKDDKEALTTQADYVNLHDVARHTIHVCETLDVAIDTVSSMIKAHDDLNSFFSGIATTKQVRMSLDFLDNILHSLRSRSASNKERLHDETQLSFNLIALHDSELAHFDSEVSIGIGRATQRDGRAMKTLAFLSLAFLPATFVSAIFSMSFYNFNPDTGKWILSSKVWIYWAVTIPVTVLTVLIWLRWSRSPLPDLVEKGQSPRRDCKTSDSSEEKSLDSRYEERKIEIV